MTLCNRLSDSMISNVGFRLDLLQAAWTAGHATFFGHSMRKCDIVSGLLQVTVLCAALQPVLFWCCLYIGCKVRPARTAHASPAAATTNEKCHFFLAHNHDFFAPKTGGKSKPKSFFSYRFHNLLLFPLQLVFRRWLALAKWSYFNICSFLVTRIYLSVFERNIEIASFIIQFRV